MLQLASLRPPIHRPPCSRQRPELVLTVHVVRQGGHGYYVSDLGQGRTDDGLVAGELPGQWSGRGAPDLGLGGTVEPEVFGDVLEGRHPGSGQSLRRVAGDRAVAGYDLTFAAPKSVSILHLLGPREIAAEVGAAHRVAVADATGYLDRAGVGVRRTSERQLTLLPATGAVAGEFVHRTSRALDPHLHTHLVVANVAQGVDGRWSSVDSRRVFAHLSATKGLYHARLRLELGRRLGAAWDVRPSGLGDVVGVEPGLRQLFSQRRVSMVEYEATRFGSARTSGLRRATFHATRPDKDTTRTVEELRGQWRERAADFGYDLSDLSRVVGRSGRDPSGPRPESIDTDRLQSGLALLAADRPTVSHRELVAAVASASTRGATAVELEGAATRLTRSAGSPVVSDRRDGPNVVRGAEARWSTAEVARSVADGRVSLVVEASDGHSRSQAMATRTVERDRWSSGRQPCAVAPPRERTPVPSSVHRSGPELGR
jgi:conjugative relaxase-like TrwC/TraI family protein